MNMKRILNEKWPWIEAARGMRSQLFDMLSDADLTFSPGGQNVTFGALCREMGETEHSYMQSLKTLKQEWSYRYPEAEVVNPMLPSSRCGFIRWTTRCKRQSPHSGMRMGRRRLIGAAVL
jgi:hypothetical protein